MTGRWVGWCWVLVIALAAGAARAQPASEAIPQPATGASPQPAAEARPRPATEARPLGRPAAPSLTPATDRAPADQPLWFQSLKTGAALGAVLVLIWGGAKGLRFLSRRGAGGLLGALGPGGRAPSGVLEVLGRYPVGRGSTLVLLKLDRRVLLVSQTQGGRGAQSGMATLCEITDPDEVASILLRTRDETGDTIAARFREHLAAEGQRAEKHAEPSAHPSLQQAHPRQPTAERPAERPAVASLRGRLAAMRQNEGVVA